MNKPITIALDAMGGDHGSFVTVPSALNALKETPELRIILVGDEQELNQQLSKQKATVNDRLSIRHASEKVEMDDSPALALKRKKDSSMRVAINLVKEGDADACVSAGNTGALMATARFVLKTLPGIDRPAIMKSLPSRNGCFRILDLGANVGCSAEHLMQFALMGAVFAEAVDKIDRPRIGVLNIGQEEMKGNEEVRQAGRLISESSLNYIGFVEGNDIFNDAADVVVCDGFVGNVALKVIEGMAKMMAAFIRNEFKRNVITRLAAFFSLPVLKALKKRFDPGRYNGATLLGLKGIVIKSHGSAGIKDLTFAISSAVEEVLNKVPEKIEKRLSQVLTESE